MSRNKNTDRIGLHFIAHTIEEEFGWVFREQSISDVGIDALVEQSINGNPTGKHLGLQIKSGEGNVYKPKDGKSYTYYISNTHYYYWLQYEMPVILVLYVKEKKKKNYWVHIKKHLIKKTSSAWSISIPKIQLLNKNSFDKINTIVTKGKNKMLLPVSETDENQVHNLSKMVAISHVSKSIDLMNMYINVFQKNITRFNSEIAKIEESGTIDSYILTVKLHREIKYVLDNLASRLFNEIHIYAPLFSDTIIGYIQKYQLYHRSDLNDIEESKLKDITAFNSVKDSFTFAIKGITALRDAIVNFKQTAPKNVLKSIDLATIALNQVLEEIDISQNMIDELIIYIKNHK